MNKYRKEIIVNEIQYWKKSRLLPEQYCDYLLTLYTEGEHESGSEKKIKRKDSNWTTFFPYLLMLIFPIAFFFSYFTEIDFILQTALYAGILLASILLSMYYFKKNGLQFTFYFIFSLLLFFLISILTVEHFLGKSFLFIGITILVQFITWFLIGRWLNITYIKYTGIIGFFLFLVYMLIRQFIL